jgi:outer membrane lipoprotein SlyB
MNQLLVNNEEMNMLLRNMNIAAMISLALVTGACSTPGQSTFGSASPVSSTSSNASGYGVVQSIETVQGQPSSGVLGSVAGAVVGGVIGNQIGGGTGRTAATIAGAAGGGLAGNRIEQNMSSPQQPSYRITVHMDNGALQTLSQNNPPNVRTGERVRVENGAIVERLR